MAKTSTIFILLLAYNLILIGGCGDGKDIDATEITGNDQSMNPDNNLIAKGQFGETSKGLACKISNVVKKFTDDKVYFTIDLEIENRTENVVYIQLVADPGIESSPALTAKIVTNDSVLTPFYLNVDGVPKAIEIESRDSIHVKYSVGFSMVDMPNTFYLKAILNSHINPSSGNWWSDSIESGDCQITINGPGKRRTE